jgi:hypothetical protein
MSEMAYFICGYFSTKLGTSVDGHEKLITICDRTKKITIGFNPFHSRGIECFFGVAFKTIRIR